MLVVIVMGNKRNRVGGVVRLGPAIRAAMATTLPIDGNNIPPIDKESRRQRTKVEFFKEALL